MKQICDCKDQRNKDRVSAASTTSDIESRSVRSIKKHGLYCTILENVKTRSHIFSFYCCNILPTD